MDEEIKDLWGRWSPIWGPFRLVSSWHRNRHLYTPEIKAKVILLHGLMEGHIQKWPDTEYEHASSFWRERIRDCYFYGLAKRG